jgi:hypothetical protein
MPQEIYNGTLLRDALIDSAIHAILEHVLKHPAI